MPETIPASHGDAAHPGPGRRVDPRILALDEHLFNPASSAWLLIDAGNTAIPQVPVASLQHGLELIGRGRVAALVGHLREGVAVIDIDVNNHYGNFLASEISDWLRRRQCWVLKRPSGGAKGRWHIFVAHPNLRYAAAADRTGLAKDISTYLARLADEFNLRRSQLDLRDAVRPLSSPHRHGKHTRPQGNLQRLMRDLKDLLPQSAPPTPLRRRVKKAPADPTGLRLPSPLEAAVVPLEFHRRRRGLRSEWRRYLLTGDIPAGSWGAPATKTRPATVTDRSLVEATCTRELAWALGDAGAAWRAIVDSHPHAMTKAKHHGEAWWLSYVWNPAVTSGSTFTARSAGLSVSANAHMAVPDLSPSVGAAREALEALKWTLPARQRPALLLVGHHLLDRILRTGKRRVPCPERDLVLDTGITDRKTIRRVLRHLNGNLGTLHTDCLSLVDREATSFEFEIKDHRPQGGREIPPPVLHPPPPAGLWATLPRSSHSLWRTLISAGNALGLREVLVNAGLVERATDEPSKSQVSTAKSALVALARAGLAMVDESGRWQAASRPRTVSVEQAANEEYARQLAKIEAERAEYRSGIDGSWLAGRARAIKVQRSKEKAWWEALPAEVRSHRRRAKQLEFEQMSLTQQSVLKATLAERRARAGINELEHYHNWIRGQSAEEFLVRCLERKRRFQILSPAERGAAVASWDRHRTRYGLTSLRTGTSPTDISHNGGVEHRILLPSGGEERDRDFFERQGQLFDLGWYGAGTG